MLGIRAIAGKTVSFLTAFSPPTTLQIGGARTHAHRAAIGKIARAKFLRRYLVTLLRPDGSTIVVRCAEPRHTVQLAVDLNEFSETERRERVAARKPKAKLAKQEVVEDTFDPRRYIEAFDKRVDARGGTGKVAETQRRHSPTA